MPPLKKELEISNEQLGIIAVPYCLVVLNLFQGLAVIASGSEAICFKNFVLDKL